MLRTRWRKRAHTPPELDITAFMNLMVALVPFLLITTVFSHISVLDLSLPQIGTAAGGAADPVAIEVVLRKDAIDIAGTPSDLARHIPNVAGRHDFAALGQALVQIKGRYPDKRDVSILAEPDIAYDDIVHAMDSARVVATRTGLAELFPEVSVGDAPRVGAER